MIKSKSLRILASSSILLLPLTTVISCNMNFEKNIKYNSISNQELFEQDYSKELQMMIQEQFSQLFLEKTFLADFYDESNRTWNQENQEFSQNQKSLLASSTNASEISENMIAFYNGHGNLAADIYNEIEENIWKNDQVSDSVHNLLNQIRTTYNRTKQIYPLETKIINKNGLEWGKITFQVDFTSPLDSRFMNHYLQLTGEVPLTLASDEILRTKIIDFAKQKNNFITDSELFKIFYQNPLRTYGLPLNFINENKQISDFRTLNFNLNVNSDAYVIQYEQTKNASIDAITGSLAGDLTSYVAKDQTGKVKEFSKDSKLKVVAEFLEKELFIENENPYIAKMFTGADKWKPSIEIVAKSGTSIEEITINDYLKNFVAFTQEVSHLPFYNDYAHFNIYFSNESHPEWIWMQTNNPLRSKVEKDQVL